MSQRQTPINKRKQTADCWDEYIADIPSVAKNKALQMVDVIRQLNRLCEQAADILDTDGYSSDEEEDAGGAWLRAWADISGEGGE